MQKKYIAAYLFFVLTTILTAQTDRWQQRVVYDMDINVDVRSHRYEGVQKLQYTNNSPDTLRSVFYHLYLNAFQPNSMMDVRSRQIEDPDRRVADRISKLKSDEIGFEEVLSLRQDGELVTFVTEGTILEVRLHHPLLPGASTQLDMTWTAQIPIQIRRNGRDSEEGIAYSMAQWYPKLCEYDYQGWHANPYIGREFYGVWGDFVVKIAIDSTYTVGGTGELQSSSFSKQYMGKKEWIWKATNVHDFMWGADPEYTHIVHPTPSGVDMHFYYQPGPKTTENWTKLPEIMAAAFDYIEKNFGPYPYTKYSFIQGGDGGMEYPMGTLITGERSLGSLVGVSVHELMHNWYQMLMGTNESLYPWMDEGFTSYASSRVMNHLAVKGLLGEPKDNPFESAYNGYRNLVLSGKEEPLATHADHFSTNFAYGIGSYVKGQVFLHQLGYIVGQDALDRSILQYYEDWKFKHPNINDFIRVVEKISDCELDWYKEYWVFTTKWIDYSIDTVQKSDDHNTIITLSKRGEMPMPIDLEIETKDGEYHAYTIPLRIMRHAKTQDQGKKYQALPDWPWTHPVYQCHIDLPIENIKSIKIDAQQRMADLHPDNNDWSQE